jgi:hypothetical protein
MVTTEQQIQTVLNQIQTLLAQIVPLREQAAKLEAELAAAQRDYERVVGAANLEASRLRARKASLQAALAARLTPPPVPPPTSPPFNPPRGVVGIGPGNQPPPPPVEDPRAARKRALADYIFYFLDDEQEAVLRDLHAIQDDARYDVGDMLELLPWGDIWQARAGWETLDDQRQRLSSWLAALQTRRDYWQRALDHLEDDSRQGLLQGKASQSAEGWQEYLAGLALDQDRDNARLRQEVQVLEDEWQKKQAQGG